jgi:hypothetical protein
MSSTGDYMHVINSQPERPPAIICDIDGTIADNKWRDPYDMSLVLNDGFFWPIIDLASMLQGNLGAKLLITSARPATTQTVADTQEWLGHTGLRWDALYMRNENDTRPDAEVKSDIYDVAIAPNYYVHYVLDDRNSVVEMWRSKGLTVLQTADGNF